MCPCPLEDSEGTEEVFIPRSSTAGFLPFLPLFLGGNRFLIDPGGVGASFYVSVHPSPSLSFSLVFFFLKQFRTFLVRKVGDGMPFVKDV